MSRCAACLDCDALKLLKGQGLFVTCAMDYLLLADTVCAPFLNAVLLAMS